MYWKVSTVSVLIGLSAAILALAFTPPDASAIPCTVGCVDPAVYTATTIIASPYHTNDPRGITKPTHLPRDVSDAHIVNSGVHGQIEVQWTRYEEVTLFVPRPTPSASGGWKVVYGTNTNSFAGFTTTVIAPALTSTAYTRHAAPTKTVTVTREAPTTTQYRTVTQPASTVTEYSYVAQPPATVVQYSTIAPTTVTQVVKETGPTETKTHWSTVTHSASTVKEYSFVTQPASTIVEYSTIRGHTVTNTIHEPAATKTHYSYITHPAATVTEYNIVEQPAATIYEFSSIIQPPVTYTEYAAVPCPTLSPWEVDAEIRRRIGSRGVCGKGHHWDAVEGGFYCQEGHHFLSDAELGL